jgi:adenylate cyclase class IV
MSKTHINFSVEDLQELLKIAKYYNKENLLIKVDQSSGIGYSIECEIEIKNSDLVVRNDPKLLFKLGDESTW